MRRLALIAPLVAANIATAETPSKTRIFAPKNDLHLQDHLFWNNSNIDEAKFNEVIDSVESHYKDVITAHGARLNIERNWNDSTVNAYAEQVGETWNVAMFGGLARRPETTPDGFALVVCHELGHHIAGFSFYGDQDWASAEGNSDYFATLACARRIWKDDLEGNAKAKATAHPTAIRKCDESWSSEADRNLCYRTAMGGQSLATLLGALNGERVDFDTPDANQVRTTDTAHPDAQCRLDTYFAGALCPVEWDHALIPGKDNADGNNSLASEAIAAKYSCMTASGYSTGLRPRCWYAPRLSVNFDKAQAKISETKGNGNGAWEAGETFAVNVPLRNSLTMPVTNATLTLTADTSDVQVENAVRYPEIAAGALAYAEADVNVGLASDISCGSRFALNAHADFGNAAANDKLDFIVGKMESLASHQEDVSVAIPDKNPAGAEIAHTFTGDGHALRAKVSVNVAHAYPGDLTMKLLSPDGKAYVFYNRIAGDRGGVNQTFVVELPNVPVAGEWRLVFIDGASMDVGTVKSFGIDFEGATCEAGLTISRLM